jgi:hypothetical protein
MKKSDEKSLHLETMKGLSDFSSDNFVDQAQENEFAHYYSSVFFPSFYPTFSSYNITSGMKTGTFVLNSAR